MTDKQQQLNQLTEIRNLMERSSRFISLSGLSGIFAGIFALAGATFAFIYLDFYKRYFDWKAYNDILLLRDLVETTRVLVIVAFIVLLLSLSIGILFTTRKARKNNLTIWDNTTKRLLYHVSVPLITGGIFCFILLYHQIYFLIAPATLIFYGLALLNGSKFTLNDVQYLGICDIILGILSAIFSGYGLVFWSVGFGIMHIVYGWIMFHKYERIRKGNN